MSANISEEVSTSKRQGLNEEERLGERERARNNRQRSSAVEREREKERELGKRGVEVLKYSEKEKQETQLIYG